MASCDQSSPPEETKIAFDDLGLVYEISDKLEAVQASLNQFLTERSTNNTTVKLAPLGVSQKPKRTNPSTTGYIDESQTSDILNTGLQENQRHGMLLSLLDQFYTVLRVLQANVALFPMKISTDGHPNCAGKHNIVPNILPNKRSSILSCDQPERGDPAENSSRTSPEQVPLLRSSCPVLSHQLPVSNVNSKHRCEPGALKDAMFLREGDESESESATSTSIYTDRTTNSADLPLISTDSSTFLFAKNDFNNRNQNSIRSKTRIISRGCIRSVEQQLSDERGKVIVLTAKLEKLEKSNLLLLAYPDPYGPCRTRPSGSAAQDLTNQIAANQWRIQLLENQTGQLSRVLAQMEPCDPENISSLSVPDDEVLNQSIFAETESDLISARSSSVPKVKEVATRKLGDSSRIAANSKNKRPLSRASLISGTAFGRPTPSLSHDMHESSPNNKVLQHTQHVKEEKDVRRNVNSSDSRTFGANNSFNYDKTKSVNVKVTTAVNHMQPVVRHNLKSKSIPLSER